MKLELDEFEARVLTETLDSYLGDLSTQIADTDSMRFREGLKQRRDALARIAEALKEANG